MNLALDPELQDKCASYSEAQRLLLAEKLARWSQQLLVSVGHEYSDMAEAGIMLNKVKGKWPAEKRRRLAYVYSFWALELIEDARKMDENSAAAMIGRRRIRRPAQWRN